MLNPAVPVYQTPLLFYLYSHKLNLSEEMDVSKNRGTPKWMVKIMENPIKMDDLGVPLFLETPKFSPRFCRLKAQIMARPSKDSSALIVGTVC